jgi:hypothetical protein
MIDPLLSMRPVPSLEVKGDAKPRAVPEYRSRDMSKKIHRAAYIPYTVRYMEDTAPRISAAAMRACASREPHLPRRRALAKDAR